MPRKSVSSLNVVPITTADSRLPPPDSMTARQKEIWRGIVQGKPSGWFSAAALPLLESYVRSISSYEHVSRLVETAQVGKTDLMELNRLFIMQERLARLFMSLATKMRLTQQSKYQARSAANTDTGKRPWDE